MRLGIYRRKENGGRYSYLAVPATRRIPEEANAIDWEKMHDGVEFDETDDGLGQFMIDKPSEQIRSKGYAITSVRRLGIPGSGATAASSACAKPSERHGPSLPTGCASRPSPSPATQPSSRPSCVTIAKAAASPGRTPSTFSIVSSRSRCCSASSVGQCSRLSTPPQITSRRDSASCSARAIAIAPAARPNGKASMSAPAWISTRATAASP